MKNFIKNKKRKIVAVLIFVTLAVLPFSAFAHKNNPQQNEQFDQKLSLAEWEVSPATRNQRITVTPLYYKTPYGPDVEIKLIYVRERDFGDSVGYQWTMSYDGFYKMDRYNGNIKFLRRSSRSVNYWYDTDEEGLVYAYNRPVRFYITNNISSVYLIDNENYWEEYDRQHGCLVSLANPQKHKLRFDRDSNGQLKYIIDAAGGTTTVNTAYSKIRSITDPLGRTAFFKYNGSRLTKVIDTAGRTNEFQYDNSYDTVTKITTPTNIYKFNPHYTSTRKMDVYQWDELEITSDNAYTCKYEWVENTEEPPGYKYDLIETHCTRTDIDARGTRKFKFYVADRRVFAQSEFINGNWQLNNSYYYDRYNLISDIVLNKPDNIGNNISDGVIHGLYNRAGQLKHVETEYSGYSTRVLPGGPNGESTISTFHFTNRFSILDRSFDWLGNLTYEASPIGTTTYRYENQDGVTFSDEATTFKLLKEKHESPGGNTLYDYDNKGRITTETRQADSLPNRITQYTYDDNGYPNAETTSGGSIYNFNYDKIGRLLNWQLSDSSGAGGNSVSYTYDEVDRIISIIDTRAGNSAQFAYDDCGLCAVTNAEDVVTTIDRDFAGRVLSVNTPYGQIASFGYTNHPAAPPNWFADTWGTSTFTYVNNYQPEKTTFPDGSTFDRVYDNSKRLIAITNQLGGDTEFDYFDPFNYRIKECDRVIWRNTETTYDAIGRLLNINYCEYDGNEMVSSEQKFSCTYEGQNISSVTFGDNSMYQFNYNGFGELASFKTPVNYTINYSYNDNGFLTGTSDSIGRQTTITPYGSTGLPKKYTDSRGNHTRFYYDSALNNSSVKFPDNTSLYKNHDSMGRVTSFTYGNSAIETDYDDIGRMTSISEKSTANNWITIEAEYEAAQPKPNKLRSFYDNSGTKTARETIFDYDNRGRMTEVEDAAGNIAKFNYNAAGQITNIIAPNQHSAAFEFDNAGRLTQEKDFHGRESSVSYSTSAKRTTVTRPDGSTVTLTKDIQDRPVSIASSGNNPRTTSFSYRSDGFLVSASCNGIVDNYSRNDNGELYWKSRNYNSVLYDNVSYSHDNGGFVDNINISTFTGNNGDTGTERIYTRDEMGRVTHVYAGSVTTSYNYSNSDGRLQHISYPNGWNKNFSYDDAGRMIGSDFRQTLGPSQDRITINNQYDPYSAARMKQQQITLPGTPIRVHNYDYDVLDQITSEQTLENGSQIDYNSYSYNGFGDRTSHNGITFYNSASLIGWHINNLDYYCHFDQRGNLDSRVVEEDMGPELERTDFSYDSDNNMIGAEVNGTNWTFKYNADNQIYYSKTIIDFEQGGQQTLDERFYIYDGLDCIAETSTSGTILREYIRVGNVGGIVAEIRNNDPTCASGYQSGTFYYHYNHRGDVIAVSSSNGSIIFKADYDAYGNITRLDNGTFEPRYTFSTKRYFKELGLYYYGFRWYMPELGKWTTKDPLSLYAGLNVYTFCINNPIALVDVYGLCSMKDLADFMRSYMSANTGNPWANKAINTISGRIVGKTTIGQSAQMALSIAFNFIDRRHQNITKGGFSKTWATLDAVNLGLGDTIGYTLFLEGWYGIDRASLNTLSTGERWKRGVIGGVQIACCVVGGAQGLHALRGKLFVAKTTQNINYLRRVAVKNAWKQEANLVQRTGRGTRPWTKANTRELLQNGKVKGFQGHHIRSVNGNPEWAGNANNISFQTRSEHLQTHGGNWRNPTWGELIKR